VLETKLVEIDGVWHAEFNETHFSSYAMIVDKTNDLSNVGNITIEVLTDTDTTSTTKNPKTGGSNAIGFISIIAILSVTTFTVVSKKRKFKLVQKR